MEFQTATLFTCQTAQSLDAEVVWSSRSTPQADAVSPSPQIVGEGLLDAEGAPLAQALVVRLLPVVVVDLGMPDLGLRVEDGLVEGLKDMPGLRHGVAEDDAFDVGRLVVAHRDSHLNLAGNSC